ncbi:D-alanyl-D-alanine carboxypeptidase (penicillin-binding protein 5/6) [Salirhabdus euzebyi]|uniref:serine-type D-Ala-D-Ala carboxypeptidase n=1 Tax=Salirhabdus euzebyi TaxID=394506 RepID=A0A841Q802_9BACI|nr:D-alanyl-D-alanine carboxypeptidase family protein [Salirhabdus euzebyi]MBB6454412.1 D-alanyl-D-alanine carboxypeptidase (penicillin-binding protein 5/6) [Salirhabdus euzebyi]
MRKYIQSIMVVMLAFLITTVSFIPNPISIHAAPSDIEAKSAIVVDAETGKILYEKEADLALPPASMTKMMTEYLVLEAIANGQISWDTTTQIGEYPYWLSSSNEFSGIGLIQNKDYTVEQLYIAMAIYSDNATTVALAELVAGTEGNFVKKMNEKAQEMGLPDAQFVNSTGLSNRDLGDRSPEGTDPEADNYLSAKSLALLAYNLIKDYPHALEYSTIKEYQLDDQMLTNLNWMLPGMPGHLEQFGYEGMDGLKTGWTDMAGYCFTGTAERNGQRLITVVMQTDSKEARFNETRKLLDYGFSNFELKEIFPANYQLEEESTLSVVKGKEDAVEIATNEPIRAVVKTGEENPYTAIYQLDESKLTKDGELTAKVEKGEVVGTMQVVYNGEEDFGFITDGLDQQLSAELVTQDSVEKANWFVLTFRAIGDFFTDLFSSIVDGIKGIF